MYYPPSSLGNPEDGSSQFLGSVRLLNNAGTEILGIQHAHNGQARTGAGQLLGIFFKSNEWNKWEFDYTVGDPTTTITITNSLGVQVANATNNTAQFGLPFTSVAALQFYRDPRVPNGAIFYDDVPEPASLALLGLGGLMMIRRRR